MAAQPAANPPKAAAPAGPAVLHVGWSGSPDPSVLLEVFTCDAIGGSSDSLWCDEKYDELLKRRAAMTAKMESFFDKVDLLLMPVTPGPAIRHNERHEPIVLARRPLEGSLGENEERWGTGRLGIDATRLPADATGTLGRWPPNVVIAHDPTCTSKCSPTCAVRRLEDSREGSSRFFYCPKPTQAERDAGCEQLRAKAIRIYGPSIPRPRRNTHPTVKPVALMRWLVRLTCPPDGTVLDPFTGSGTTGIAAVHEQRTFIGIERESRYLRIARLRLHHAESALKGGPD